MRIIKINDAIKEIQLELDKKIKNVGLTEEQVNYLYAVARAKCGYKLKALLINEDIYYNSYTLAGDMIDATKRSAIRNILNDVCGITIMDDYGEYKDVLFYVYDMLKAKLKLCECNNILQYYDEAYVVNSRVTAEEDVYIIAVDEDGCVDDVRMINNKLAIFCAIKLNDEQIEQNEDLVKAIENIKSNN